MAANIDVLNRAWEVVTKVLVPFSHYAEDAPPSNSFLGPEAELQEAMDVLQQHKMAHIAEEWFLECMQKDLRQNIVPSFWKFFKCSNEAEQENLQFFNAVEFLHSALGKYKPGIERLECMASWCKVGMIRTGMLPRYSLKMTVMTLYKALLFASMNKRMFKVIEKFYLKAFKVYQHTSGEDQGDEQDVEDTAEEEAQCCGCGVELELCQCADIMEKFHIINRKLDELYLLDKVAGSCITNIVHQVTKQHVEQTCKGNVETSFLEGLEKWLDKKVLGWLNLVYCSDPHVAKDTLLLAEFKETLRQYMYETYACTLIDQLFNIIIEFPESEPAILDLKSCLMKTDLRSHLVSSLKTALENRLLHPGVNTSDILTAYISAIRALRVLDPAGVLLELVCEPVQKYLRSRDNTVRCIVSSLTEEGANELSDELIRGMPRVIDDNAASDDELEEWNKWIPDPVDADPASMSKSRRTSDIISMLVNIYGSKELFVNEYRNLLADRVLSQFSHNTEKEIRYLELLKLRFGETQLHYCEVMLKDVTDSRRINTVIRENKKDTEQAEGGDDIDINMMILSAQFWPPFREEKLTLPENMQRCLENYTKKFESLKGNRTLVWKSHLGLVNIDIELKERTLNLNVSPVHAAIIMQFQNKGQWTVEELSSILQIPATALRRKLAYWQSQGLLREEATDTFVLVEERRSNAESDIIITAEEETESAMASMRTQREEQMQVFWTYIVGMLTNLESLPIERIHSMLRMFAVQGPSTVECSIGELKIFLDKKVKEQQLLYSSGVYRLPRNN